MTSSTAKPLPPLALVQELLSYSPDTGKFVWRRPRKGLFAGREAGRVQGGYRAIGVAGAEYKAHRLAWLYMTESDPVIDIDHINGDKQDNRWVNLRLATRSLNHANKKTMISSGTGFKGVSAKNQRYTAKVTLAYKTIHLGTFDTPEEAHAAYVRAAATLFGEFANSGELRTSHSILELS